MIEIKNYTKEQYPLILSWWTEAKEFPPEPDMLPEESTYVLYDKDEAQLCVTLYLTNSKSFVMVDNFIGNPKRSPKSKREFTRILLRHLEEEASKLGYKRLFCFGIKDKIKSYYGELGFKQTMDNVSTFTKEIICLQ